MFKYITDILKTISPGQRIVALSLLLLSITIIVIGPKLIDGFTQDNEELTNKIGLQKKELVELSSQVEKLNSDLIKSQEDCTNRWGAREREILKMVSMIEQEALLTTRTRISQRYSYVTDPNDTDMVLASAPPPDPIEKEDTGKMLEMVTKLKKSIQSDLSKK